MRVGDFDFVSDDALRQVLVADTIEANTAYSGRAYKAAALLAASVLEGMLLDFFQSEATAALEKYEEAVAGLRRRDGSINWKRASLRPLILAAVRVGLFSPDKTAMVALRGNDVRDTVHARAEVRRGYRAGQEEADELFDLVDRIYERLENDDWKRN